MEGPVPDPVGALAAAIAGRHTVELHYDGAWRVVHPHALGRTAKGAPALLAWQTAGHGRSAEPEGWRLFDLRRAGAVQPLRATFAPRPRPADGRWSAGLTEEVVAV